MTIRERQRQLREDSILTHAYALLLERGYEGMTMDEVAARVGIAKMTLYTHFASKEILTVALIVQRMQALHAELTRLAYHPSPTRERLRAMLHYTVMHHLEKWSAQLAIERRIVQTIPMFQEVDAKLIALWREVVEQGKQDGCVRRELATTVIVQIIRRLYTLGFEDVLFTREATPEDIAQTVVAILWNGIEQPSS